MPYLNITCPHCRKTRAAFHNVRKCRDCGKPLAVAPTVSQKPASIREAVAELVRQRRTAYGISQKRLSAASGLSVSFLSDLEGGKRSPSLETWIAIIKAMNGCPAAMLGKLLRSME